MLMEMKKTRTCPKCGSVNIAGPFKNKGPDGSIIMGVSTWFTATYEIYTCMGCGYSEFYPDRKGLENIREHYNYRG